MPQLYLDPHAPDPVDYAVVRLDAPASGILAPGEVWERAHAIEWGPAEYRTRFRACWDDRALHVRWDAVDPAPWHTMTSRDDHIWEEEVVELFLDADGTGRHYAELEISPANVVCDLCVESPWPALRSLTAWNWNGMESRVEPLTGGQAGWTALARLPWAGLRSLYPNRVALPPAPLGSSWRFNVFRIKRPGGPERPEDGVVYAAWSRPQGPSFHDPEAFRPLRFLP
jgi:hypothetical protein